MFNIGGELSEPTCRVYTPCFLSDAKRCLRGPKTVTFEPFYVK